MALLLNIETSVPICSVSIANDGICLAESRSDIANDHIAQLTSLIIETLKKTGNKLKDLDAIAVSSGRQHHGALPGAGPCTQQLLLSAQRRKRVELGIDAFDG